MNKPALCGESFENVYYVPGPVPRTKQAGSAAKKLPSKLSTAPKDFHSRDSSRGGKETTAAEPKKSRTLDIAKKQKEIKEPAKFISKAAKNSTENSEKEKPDEDKKQSDEYKAKLYKAKLNQLFNP
ncbi:hypothetical protein HELRODRAFT_172644 [Helobdella robusta]|uniref:Uncharacterized protein n=1 Tax=Helobdella robusta TaxID=6412 RepID=T1F5P8_HELRO|nr:hypothetical protein HELRODRAFT_172643 [Helobdella robusta]XP_009017556.1 hypothetical protein HELRODRAFT_172644 [Helobdella robusta]ESO04286.1 hypothetical protein HELRODRAFT_172643 [Helobdella robusta]ESO04287.1 hypothetical protein HELRODRAFT_172644 [Helobdella robusta]